MKLYNGNCFDYFSKIEDESVDLVLVDPPYGTTSIDWDKELDFDKMWIELDRLVKPKSNIIIFGSQPFTSKMILSKVDWFRYELVWNKNKCGSPGLAKYRPQKVHENIMIFSKESGALYNPIMEEGDPYSRFNEDGYGSGTNRHGYGFGSKNTGITNDGTRYPKSILHASRNFSAQQTTHPTQKPTNLLAWLIMTFSKSNDTVLDFTMGTGSSAVASKMTGRKFIGIEKKTEFFDIAELRTKFCKSNSVSEGDYQLTTQISKDMNTIPTTSHEEDFNRYWKLHKNDKTDNDPDGIEKWLQMD